MTEEMYDNDDMPTEESGDFEVDWTDFATAGLLPVGRVHFTINNVRITNKRTDDGVPYRSIGVQYVIDRHSNAELPSGKTFYEKGWLNFSTLSKTAQRFINLYTACVGHAPKPTERTESGKPKVDLRALLDEIKGLGAYSQYVWRKQDDNTFEAGLGWDFAQNMDDLREPTNPTLEDAPAS